MTRTWTPREVRALGVRTDLPTACEAALGIGRSAAYEAFRRGALPFPAVRVGRAVVVPVAGVLRFLGLDEDEGPGPPRQAGTGPS